MGTTFKIDLGEAAKKVDDNVDTKQAFSIVIPIEGYVYIKGLMSHQTRKGNLNYRLKAAFSEGLSLLREENPLVKDDATLERRFYMGGEQKSKIESFSTSVIIPKKDVNWINNYILQERKKDEFFSKTDFINNLVDQLKKQYGKSL